MSGRSGHNDPFSQFGDIFAGFGGFGGQRSLISGFGGRDPFDDPFFTRPFGGMLGSNLFESSSSSLLNAGPYGVSMGSHMMNGLQSGLSTQRPLTNAHPSHFLEKEAPQVYRSKGPIIEELNSDDEVVEDKDKRHTSKKHGRSSKGPYVETEERRSKQMKCRNEFNNVSNSQPNARAQSFTFQSSSVTYGGSDGAYYTKSRTMRTGTDGLTIDETKEADSTTGRAAHRLSRGIYDKGHTVSRNLQSDGRVNTKQILHNINQDDLIGFEEAWKENAGKHLPGWNEVQNGTGPGNCVQTGQHSRGGWALSSTEEGDGGGSSQIQHTRRTRKKVGEERCSAQRR